MRFRALGDGNDRQEARRQCVSHQPCEREAKGEEPWKGREKKLITGRPRSTVVQSWGCAEEAVGRGDIISLCNLPAVDVLAPNDSDGYDGV